MAQRTCRVRAFEQADFDFQPGMNLLVGVNGAGKSTILDVLRMMFSYTLPQFTAAPLRPTPFAVEDITVGQGALTIDLDFQIDQTDFNHLVHIPRHTYDFGGQPDNITGWRSMWDESDAFSFGGKHYKGIRL